MSAEVTLFFGIQMKWALPPSYMVGEPVSLLSLWDPQRPEAYQCLHFSGDCLCVSPFMGLDQFLALSVHNSPETKLYSPDYWESFKATDLCWNATHPSPKTYPLTTHLELVADAFSL